MPSSRPSLSANRSTSRRKRSKPLACSSKAARSFAPLAPCRTFPCYASAPGVAIGSEDFRNDIIARGGSPLENLFIVDNVEIPNINTFANFASAGGITSIFDANLIQDVTFSPAATPCTVRQPALERAADRAEGRQPREFGGRATVGFAGWSRARRPDQEAARLLIVSARRSFLDLFTNDVGFGGVPKVHTFSGKALYDLSPKDRIWGVNISGVDSIRLGLTEDSDLTEELSALDIRYQGWRSASGFNWQHLFGSQGVGLLGITHSGSARRVDRESCSRTGSPTLPPRRRRDRKRSSHVSGQLPRGRNDPQI
ncbi:MAG: hypothetical protein R2724_05705 [Bryobacterales bacterium]